MDHVGLPIKESLPIVINLFRQKGLKQRIKVIASGKMVLPSQVAWALATGADFIASARGNMFALGCIQALQLSNGWNFLVSIVMYVCVCVQRKCYERIYSSSDESMLVYKCLSKHYVYPLLMSKQNIYIYIYILSLHFTQIRPDKYLIKIKLLHVT